MMDSTLKPGQNANEKSTGIWVYNLFPDKAAFGNIVASTLAAAQSFTIKVTTLFIP